MPKISKSKLIKLQKSLKTDSAIGKKFNVTRQAIHQIRQKYGIKAILGKNDERNAIILSLSKKGATVTAIAKKVGLSVPHTYRIIKMLAIATKRYAKLNKG
jgi:hypothetical protein